MTVVFAASSDVVYFDNAAVANRISVSTIRDALRYCDWFGRTKAQQNVK